jgi:hypothetical protein
MVPLWSIVAELLWRILAEESSGSNLPSSFSLTLTLSPLSLRGGEKKLRGIGNLFLDDS